MTDKELILESLVLNLNVLKDIDKEQKEQGLDRTEKVKIQAIEELIGQYQK